MENIVFLVAVPRGALYHCCKQIQKSIWKKYNLEIQQELPEIHLTMDAFYYEDLEDIEKIKRTLKELIKEIHPFEIRSNGFGYIPSPHKCITLHVVKTEELKNTYASIHSHMIRHGFKVRKFSSEEILFHISLAGIHGRDWSEEESLYAWNEIKNFKLKEIALLDEFELWFPELDPEKRCITKMTLGSIK